MRSSRLLAVLATLALAFAPSAATAAKPAPRKAAAPADWSRVVTMAGNGAYVLGNPKAPNRLVEYLSYTCPHCAHFQSEGMGPLKSGAIRRGQLALEFRNFIRDPFDLSAALLARCGGGSRFLANHEALFANQEPWMTQAQSFADDTSASHDQVAVLTRIAEKTGLIDLLARRGLDPGAQRRCIADKQAMSYVLNLTAGAWDNKDFTGTPFFVFNGKPMAGAHSWDRLKPLLPPLLVTGK